MEPRPRFGFGRDGRPLETEQDRDSEEVRNVLRRAGFAEVDDGRSQLGFWVKSDREGIEVVSTDDDPDTQLARYAQALRQGEWEVVPCPDDDLALTVWRRPQT